MRQPLPMALTGPHQLPRRPRPRAPARLRTRPRFQPAARQAQAQISSEAWPRSGVQEVPVGIGVAPGSEVAPLYGAAAAARAAGARASRFLGRKNHRVRSRCPRVRHPDSWRGAAALLAGHGGGRRRGKGLKGCKVARGWELQFPWCFRPDWRALPPGDGVVRSGICSLMTRLCAFYLEGGPASDQCRCRYRLDRVLGHRWRLSFLTFASGGRESVHSGEEWTIRPALADAAPCAFRPPPPAWVTMALSLETESHIYRALRTASGAAAHLVALGFTIFVAVLARPGSSKCNLQ